MLKVVLHERVVPTAGGFVSPVDPEKYSIDGIMHTHNALIADPVWTQNCLISAEKSIATLHNKSGVECNVVLFAGSPSRKLFASNRPWVSTDKMVVRPPSLVGPPCRDEAMLQDFLQDHINDKSLAVAHQLGHEIDPDIGLRQLVPVEVRDGKRRVKRENPFPMFDNFACSSTDLLCPGTARMETTFHGKPFLGCIGRVRLCHLYLKSTRVTVSDN